MVNTVLQRQSDRLEESVKNVNYICLGF